MNQQEFKQLTYKIVPALQEHFRESKEEVEVRVLQDTLNQQSNPFHQPSLLIGVGYKGTNFMEVYQVTNNGNEATWQFAGNTQV